MDQIKKNFPSCDTLIYFSEFIYIHTHFNSIYKTLIYISFYSSRVYIQVEFRNRDFIFEDDLQYTDIHN